MAENFVKTKRHVLTDSGYKTISQWTNAESVEMNSGTDVQTEITNLKNTATTTANGLMSSSDKSKLDSIAASANNYTHPTYTSAASALRKFSVDGTGHVNSTAEVAKVDITSLGIPAQDTTYAVATTNADGLMSSNAVTKLAGIETSANNYTHPTYASAASGLYKVAVDGTGHVSEATAVVKADITGLGIPAQDTTYANVTNTANGLMTSVDKKKLDTIAASANNYVHPSYTSADNGLYKITISEEGHVTGVANVLKADITGLGIPAQDTTYAAATTDANGLMTAADKGKLDSIAASANNYVHPSYTSAVSALRKFTVDDTGHISGTAAIAKADITELGIPAQDTTYAVATTNANGLMTSTDKGKLDSIAASANNYTHPTYTSYASALRKFTVDDTGHVSATAAVAKADITELGIPSTDTTYAAATTAANGLMTAADKEKLDSIAASAQVNTITGVKGDAENSYRTGNINITPDNIGAIATSAKGAVNGVAPLNASGLIDSTYLPAYVDDVLEFESRSAFPTTGESGKIYVDISAEENNTYRWSGSTYILIAKNTNTTYSISKSGSTVTLTGSDGSTTSFTDADTTYATATTAANGLMSSSDKGKLDSIAASANNYVHPSYTSAASGLYKVAVDGTGHISGATAVAKADITGLGIPAQDTTYAVATTNANGLAPKLTGSTDVYLNGNGTWTTPINTTYAVATTDADGLMSSGDKGKLDSIAANANNYVHPTYTSVSNGLYKVTVDDTGHVSATAAVAKADITNLGIPAQDTTYAAATTAANGLMTAADKIKSDSLKGIYSVKGTQTATTGTWTGSIDAPALYDGMTIAYYLPRTGSGNATLNLTLSDGTQTGPIDCYFNSTSRLTTQYGAGSTIILTYWSAGSISVNGTATTDNRWTHADYNVNTTYAAATSDKSGLINALSNDANTFYNGIGEWSAPINTTYAAATTDANGLMSSTDKGKLDSIAASANNYVHPSYTSAASALRKFTVDGTGHVSATAAVAKADITGLGIPSTDTTYAAFTSADNGLVPAAKNGSTNYATSGYVLTGAGWAAGTKYNTDTDTTYAITSITAEGLAPKLTGSTDVYLNGNGTWTTPTNTTYATFTSAANGLVPAAKNGSTSYLTSGYVLTGAGWKAGTKYNTDTDTTYAVVTTAANGLMTSTDKGKLDSIAASANNYVHPSYTSAASGLYKVAVDGTGHISGATAVAKADITGLGIPAQDTTYAAFTSANNGLVPAAKNGSTSYLTSGYVLTGAGWKAGTKYNTDTDTTYATATTAANGLMSNTDKGKLDSIAASANNYVHPSYTSAASALRKFTVDDTGHVSGTATVIKADITGLGIPAQDTTYAAATTAANGLMTSTDKGKLDSIAASANNYVHPSYTSASNGLYKVTVDDTGHVSGTAAVAKADITELGIPGTDTTYAAATTAAIGLTKASYVDNEVLYVF